MREERVGNGGGGLFLPREEPFAATIPKKKRNGLVLPRIRMGSAVKREKKGETQFPRGGQGKRIKTEQLGRGRSEGKNGDPIVLRSIGSK